MKRLLLLLLLLPALAWGQVSTSGVSLSGCSTGTGVASLSCTTSDDSKIWNPTAQPGASADPSTYCAAKIVLSATTRITAYKLRLTETGDTGSVTVSLYNDDGNGATSKPTTEVADTSINVLSTSISSGVQDWNLATPKEVAAGTYWVVRREVDSASTNQYYNNASSGDRACYGSDGSSWTCVDNSGYDMELWGCQ